jgi:uncharacterized membrane protein HdeD (DUF308 family)
MPRHAVRAPGEELEEAMDDGGRTGLQEPTRLLLRGTARYWWVMLVVGVAWLLLAWVVLRADVGSLTAVGVLLGIVFVAAGVNEAALAGLVSRGWKVLHYVLGALFVLAGLWAFIRPINTFFALASVLGLVLLFAGTFDIVRGVASRGETPYWWTGLVSGVALLLLALWVSTDDPSDTLARRTFLILFWVGVMALFRGIASIMLAFTLRHVGRTPAGEVPGGPSGIDVADVVPPQERRAPATSPEVPRT